MNRNLKLYLYTSLLFLSMITLPVYAEKGVVIALKDGTAVSFAFSEKPSINIGENIIITTYFGKNVLYDYVNVQKIFWGDTESTNITSLKNNGTRNVQFRIKENGIEILGLSYGERVMVHTTNGVLVASTTSLCENGKIELAIALAKPSVYIVSTSKGVKFKVLNR